MRLKYLLDTHIALWSSFEDHKLSTATRSVLTDPQNDIFFSLANIWETSVKRAKGRPDFQVDPALFRTSLLMMGFVELGIDSRHVIEVGTLPDIHGDPFDRLLIAQARIENIQLLTVDKLVLKYGQNIRKA